MVRDVIGRVRYVRVRDQRRVGQIAAQRRDLVCDFAIQVQPSHGDPTIGGVVM